MAILHGRRLSTALAAMHTCRWAPRGVKTAIMSRGPDRSPRKPRGVRVANRLTSPATRRDTYPSCARAGALSVASCLVTRPLPLARASWAVSASKRVRALARSIAVVVPRHPASSSISGRTSALRSCAPPGFNHRQTVHSCAVMAQPSLDTFNPAVSVPLKAHRSADVATGVVRPDLPRNFPHPGWRSCRALRQACPCGAQGEKDGVAPFDAVKHTAKYGKARAQAAGLRYECNTTPGCQEQVRAGKWGKGGAIEPWRPRPPTRVRTKSPHSRGSQAYALPPGGGHGACAFMTAEACGQARGRLHGTLTPAPALMPI